MHRIRRRGCRQCAVPPDRRGIGRPSDAALLHDGRARTLEEAILWHGGEAADTLHAFTRSTARERGNVIAFLESL